MADIEQDDITEDTPSGVQRSTPQQRHIVASRIRTLVPRLYADAPQHAKLIRSIESAATPKSIDLVHKRLGILADELLADDRLGEPLSPSLKRLLGIALGDANPTEYDSRGRKVHVGAKPRSSNDDWEQAGMPLVTDAKKPGPDKEFPVRLDLRVGVEHIDALARIGQRTHETRNGIIRRLIQEADPGA